MASNRPAIDFITYLPPELVVDVLTFIKISDVFSCMKVCKRWYDKIRSLQTYWRLAVSLLGVSSETKNEGAQDYFSLAVKVWKNRQYIGSSTPEVAYVSPGYHRSLYFHCTYCRHGTLVATLYEDFSPAAILVYKIQPGSKRLVRKNQFAPVLRTPLGRVCWSHVYCDYLLLATACGRWLGYDLVMNVKLLDWKGPDLYDQEVLICCCESCYLVVLAKLICHRKLRENYWEIDVISLGRGCKQPVMRHYSIATLDYTPSTLTFGCKNSAIIAKVGPTVRNNFCSSHLLLLQLANTVTVYEMNHDQVDHKPLRVLDSNTDKIDVTKEVIQGQKRCHSPFSLSFDNSLIGFIFTDKLHVWNLHTLNCESSVSIQRSKKDAQVCLLALGHVHSLIGYESLDGHLKIISTYSGKSILSTHGFSGVFSERQQTIGTPPPYFIFLGVVDEHWLNNIQALPHPSIPIILYWEKKEHCVLGIVLKHSDQDNNKLSAVPLYSRPQDQTTIVQSKLSNLKKRLKFF